MLKVLLLIPRVRLSCKESFGKILLVRSFKWKPSARAFRKRSPRETESISKECASLRAFCKVLHWKTMSNQEPWQRPTNYRSDLNITDIPSICPKWSLGTLNCRWTCLLACFKRFDTSYLIQTVGYKILDTHYLIPTAQAVLLLENLSNKFRKVSFKKFA